MIKEVEYAKSPAFMDKAELKQEIWRLKGLLEKKDLEIKQLKTIAAQGRASIIIDTKWEDRYRKLLTLYKSIKGKKPVPTEYQGEYEKIINSVCSFYGVEMKDLQSKSRKRKFTRPRHVLFFLLYGSGVTLSEIGALFNRDHSTAIHGRDVVINEINTFSNDEQELIKTLCK